MAMNDLLLISPWIYDFAAYDLWLKPLGLLTLSSILRQHGYSISYIDCLNRHHPVLADYGFSSKTKKYGSGDFYFEVIPKPKVLKDIPRKYKRYGLPPEAFKKELDNTPNPEAILITAMATYWYPGVQLAVEMVREKWPDVPVFLGGLYPSVCLEHAKRFSGADFVYPSTVLPDFFTRLGELTGKPDLTCPAYFASFPAPDLQPGKAPEPCHYAIIATSLGCPFSCDYCASDYLYPGFNQKSPDIVYEEILHFVKTSHIKNIAIYDDALLVNPEEHIIPLLKKIVANPRLHLNFHTPNSTHARLINQEVADLLFKSGFKNLRISLETSRPERQKNLGDKVTNEEFARAVKNLHHAGFKSHEIWAYIMIGMPDQEPEEVLESMLFSLRCGAQPVPVEYSPIPHTRLWPLFAKEFADPENIDPLLHNNSVTLYRSKDSEILLKLKNLSKLLRQGLHLGINLFDDSDLARRFKRIYPK
jgi:radical SAM superfamily enzyme YgiQ (UPF0313 family)